VARTLNNIGNIFDNKGEWDAALAHYQRARDVLERLGDTAGVATTLNNIGHVYEKQGRLPDAVSLMEQCVELERRLGHPDAEKDSAYLEQLRAKALKVPSVS
jgi:tetratricopeptide (TPR) repeat protein